MEGEKIKAVPILMLPTDDVLYLIILFSTFSQPSTVEENFPDNYQFY